MDILENSLRGTGMDARVLTGAPWPSVDAAAVQGLLARCPAAAETPLVAVPGLGPDLWVKDERGRMGLGSFKALGAAYVIACDAAATGTEDMSRALAGRSYVTASAGNHGLSVAAGARVFGARAVVYLAETVPESFAARLREKGAEVVRAGADYAGSIAAAEAAAAAGVIWTAENFVNYVQGPTAFLRQATGDSGARSKMTYRVRDEQEAKDLYAYLASLSAE